MNSVENLAGQGIAGRYYISIKIGPMDLYTDPSNLAEVYMIECMELMIPMIKLVFIDRLGIIYHTLLVKDKQKIAIKIGLTPVDTTTGTIEYTLTHFIAENYGSVAQNAQLLTMYGVLSLDNLFELKSRSFSARNIVSAINTIAKELGVSSINIGSIRSSIPLLQPMWSNIMFLQDIAKYATGYKDGGVLCYVDTDKKLTFKSVSELIKNPVKLKLMYGRFSVEPVDVEESRILDYKVISNTRILQDTGARGITLDYYDYFTDEFIPETITTDRIHRDSLVNTYFISDTDKSGVRYVNGGSIDSDDKLSYFTGLVKNDILSRADNLSKMEVLIDGYNFIHVGDVVYVSLFREAHGEYNFFYSGKWLVSRCIQSIKNNFMTKLVLIRTGLSAGNINPNKYADVVN